MQKITTVILLLFLCTYLSGCANISDDSTRTRTEGALAGGGIGALLCGGGALLLTKDAGEAAKWAAICGGIGALGGLVYANNVINEKDQYDSTEQWLDACIEETKKNNESMAEYNQNLEKQIASLKEENKTLKSQYKKDKNTKSQLVSQKEKIDELAQKTNESLDVAKKDLENRKQMIAEANNLNSPQKSDYTTSVKAEIETLKANIKELEKHSLELASLSSSMAV
ncbi:hypothetical protein [Desulfogranum japonicum]|uniref:hypothetical protein n=1 Tax=Desulfogranum japonicum TaxID=231447 RepID=UPI00042330B6|nr:hypothetical protein [Desulfogranum japonicum]